MWATLSAYPFATASSIAFYAILILLAHPHIRGHRLAMPVTRSGAGNGHLNGFDAYRGFAALFVAAGHIWYFSYPLFAETQLLLPWLEYGAAAVPIFCVLSGFLIYRTLRDTQDVAGLRAYGIRRFFRIYPVYLLGVILCAAFGLYSASSMMASIRSFFADLFMFRVLWWPSFANPVAWSLYYEVMFYAFLPVIMAVIGRRRMGVFAALGILAMLLGDASSRDFGLWRFFLLGILAAEISPVLKRSSPILFVVGAALVAFDLSGPPGKTDWFAMIGLAVPRHDQETMGLGIGFALMLATTPHLVWVGRALETYPLRLLGLISYSLYITHPFYILANFPQLERFSQNVPLFEPLGRMPWWYLPLLFVPGALFWALVSYVLLERPGIAFGRKLARRQVGTPRKVGPSTEHLQPTPISPQAAE